MKKQVLILLLVLVAGTSSFAQCDKKSVLTAGLTEYLKNNCYYTRRAGDGRNHYFNQLRLENSLQRR
jgi:hypothetical protein